MKKIVFVFLIFSGCAHGPRCGTPEGALVVFEGEKTCQVRIRQVTVGRDLKIPKTLKANLASLKLEWVEPKLDNGQISLGHFVLIPESKAQ